MLAVVTSASDPDNDPITFSYQWQESTNNTEFADLAGQTASNLAASITIAGDYYRVIITPNDGQTNGAPFTTASVLVPADADGNGISLSAEETSEEEAKQIVKTFLTTEFAGGLHLRRIEKIREIEKEWLATG